MTSHAGTLDSPPSSGHTDRARRDPPVPNASDATRTLDVEQLFRDHGPYVWRSLRRFGLTDTDADDLTQEVFVVVFKRLHEFEHRSSLRTWVYGIAMRLALAHRRRASNRRELPTETPPEVVAKINAAVNAAAPLPDAAWGHQLFGHAAVGALRRRPVRRQQSRSDIVATVAFDVP